MTKVLIVRSARTLLLAFVSVLVLLYLIFSSSPDVGYFKSYIEYKVKNQLHAKTFDFDGLSLSWKQGPYIDFGQVTLKSSAVTIMDGAHAELSWSLEHVLSGKLLPVFSLSGGTVSFDFDQQQQTGEFNPPPLYLSLRDVQFVWRLNNERQTLADVQAVLSPGFDEVWLSANGLNLSYDYSLFGIREVALKMDDFSILPASWQAYAPGIEKLHLGLERSSSRTWQWSLSINGNQGAVKVPQIHLTVPLTELRSSGEFSLQRGSSAHLQNLEVPEFHWRDGENFADFTMGWKDEKLHIAATDGSVTMPMLWSWLWLLGEDGWHQWLTSMKHGRLDKARATLDLHWENPLAATPTIEDARAMKYHVTTYTHDADVALGLGGDFLNHVDALVEVDQDKLVAKISTAELNGVGQVSGDYTIHWSNLVMDIYAQGDIDLGKLHHWLEPESAKTLHWKEAPSTAELYMQWDVAKNSPDKAHAVVTPSDPWKLTPLSSPMTVSKADASWDIERGLYLDHMKVVTPWFDGDLDVRLDEQWNLEHVALNGKGSLVSLTKQFSLPVVKPEGQTAVRMTYKEGQWKGQLDFSQSDWDSFAGYDKKGNEALIVPIQGTSALTSVLPIHIQQLSSRHKDFAFNGKVVIDDKNIDFRFSDIVTPAVKSDLRLLIPVEERLAWGLEADAKYVERHVFQQYLKSVDSDSKLLSRPWNINARCDWLAWDENYAEDVSIQLSSNKGQTHGNFTTAYVATKDVDIEKGNGSFTKLAGGKFELNRFEAWDQGQHMLISGSAMPKDENTYDWQGMVVMDGQFGQLMKQAELDQLFKDGQMHSLLLGKGEFKDGEPWWRKLKANLRLRVDEGRILEGGTLTKLLSVISIIDLPKFLAFQREDLIGEGVLYDQMRLEADFDEQNLSINQLAIRSSALSGAGSGTMNMESGDLDLLLVVRPWQNIEAIVGYIPLLGDVLTGKDKSFLRKVYHVHGPASDAAVEEKSPEEAGLPSSGVIETLFSLPGELLGD